MCGCEAGREAMKRKQTVEGRRERREGEKRERKKEQARKNCKGPITLLLIHILLYKW
jgi:hypothetical protein